MRVDEGVTSRLRERALAETKAETRQIVVGWLHMADLQPNEAVIKTALGTEWTCRFGPEMKSRVLELLDQVVVAEGAGTLRDRTGELTIELVRRSLPEAYQMTIDREFEAIVKERVRRTPARRSQTPAAGTAHVNEDDIDRLMAAIKELDA
jgi:hypothetical protein